MKKPSGVTIAKLMTRARPEWRRLALGIFFLAIASGMGLLYPQAMRRILDEALGAKNPEAIDRTALAMGVIFLIQGIAIGLRYFLFTTAGERVVTSLREELYANILRQEIGFFDARKTGELTSRLSADTTVIQSTVSANISMTLRNLANVVGGVFFLFGTSARLATLMLAIVPPVAVAAVFYGRKVRGLSREVQDALASANDVADETIGGIRTVRSFAAEAAEHARYRSAVERSFQLARKRAMLASTFMASASFAAYLSAAVILWSGGRMVLSGELSVGSLTQFLVYTMLVAFSLGGLSDVWADLMRATGAAERVFELLDRKALTDHGQGVRLPVLRGDVAFHDVHFAYPSRKDVGVLNGLSFEVRAGEVVALVGPSGAGKSTVAAMLGRHYDVDRGTVSVDGADVRTLDADWLRQNVGTVAQEPILFSSSIADNIRYAKPSATDAEVEAAAKAANAHEFISRFPDGYRTLVGERGVQLSGGQKQRVAIARAVLKDPRILILDEATSALDAESEHLVQEALERLMKQRTTLVIAHRLSTVIHSDRVLVLEQGRVVQSGSHTNLMAEQGLYRRLVERQFVPA